MFRAELLCRDLMRALGGTRCLDLTTDPRNSGYEY
jgi:hypothetical protein